MRLTGPQKTVVPIPGLACCAACNPAAGPVAGAARYNAAHREAGEARGFFTKIACFGFEEQVPAARAGVRMPVTFRADPEIVTDRDAKYVHSITRSDTFYEIDLPDGDADPGQASNTNLN